ncbi:ABC transporter ATP-binding protein [Spirochaetota bacterium]
MEPILKVKNITCTFGGLRAIDDVSFSVNNGEIFSIIGPNGAGKTTIFNCISGIYTPDTGTLTFKGENLNELKPYKIAELGIARTFQNIELFSRMTVMENLMLGRHLHLKGGLWSGALMWSKKSRIAREEIEHRNEIEKIIDLLELQSVRDNFVSDLPYGKQKLVELGRALALEPEILLLDEPSAGMNNEEKQDLIFWLKDIQDVFGITIIMIEHDMKMVMDISNRILAINFGKLIVEGKGDEVANHPEVLKAYLGEEGEIA